MCFCHHQGTATEYSKSQKANIVVALTSLLSTKPALLDAPEEDDSVAMEVEGQDDPTNTNISDAAVTNAEA